MIYSGAMLATDRVMQSMRMKMKHLIYADKLITDKLNYKSAFVIGRPPGHHAGPQGLF
jgi:acetoin utilization deacetylase AcuC-like enzyme